MRSTTASILRLGLDLARSCSDRRGATRWNGPYLKKAEGLVDPWGRPYQYRLPGRDGAFDIFTLGRDNAAGGTGEDSDVTN